MSLVIGNTCPEAWLQKLTSEKAMGNLPNKVTSHIFSYLPLRDIATMQRVNHACYALAEVFIYHRACLRDFPHLCIPQDRIGNYDKAFYLKHVALRDKVAQKIESRKSLLILVSDFMFNNPIYPIVFSRKGDKIVTVGSSSMTKHLVKVFQVATGTLLNTCAVASEWDFLPITFSWLNDKLVMPPIRYIRSLEKEDVFEIIKSDYAEKMIEPIKLVYNPLLSRDGTKALGISDNLREVSIIDTIENKVMYTLSHPKEISSAIFSLDGTMIATRDSDQIVCIWDAETGRLKKALKIKTTVLCIAFSPDGKRIAVGNKQDACIWDIEKSEKQHTLSAFGNSIHALSFSPCGRYVVTGSHDGTICFFKGDTGERKQARQIKGVCIQELTFSPDGTKLAAKLFAMNKNNYLYIWDFTPLEE